MANIRIKDLANTASSSASDDFIAVDGTTNGTRKLNAFSPTFGGNATVTGTLTVNGAATFNATAIISSAGIANAYLTINNTFGKEVRLYSGIVGTNNNGFSVRNETNTTDWLTIDGSGNVKVPATTASTTTSSGALVVSGGVGVAGALNCGGLFDFAVSANSTQVYTIQNTSTGVSAATRLTFVGGASSGNIQLYGSGHSTPNILQYASPDTHKWQCNGVERASLSSAGVLSLLATTASTSTSTGALVVSGGVGVAGAIYLGVKLNISTHDSSTGGIGFGTDISLYRSAANTLAFDTTGNAAVLNVRESGTLTAAIGTVTGDLYLQTQQAGKKVYIKTANAATAATFDENQKATFAATIKTAAPSGGTAAEWKLGTVATVSPTSPNRTIEVDIGGTIYYIHAKTTNN